MLRRADFAGTVTIDPQVLDFIRCPVTRQPVSPLPGDDLASLNRLIGEGKIKSRDDTLVLTELSEALVTEDGKLAYPIVDGLPLMMEEHSVPLSQLDAS